MLTVLPVQEAQERILRSLEGFTLPEVWVPTSETLGRVTARPVVSPEMVPAYARSTMDGFAVRAEDTFGASESLPALLHLTGKVPMGQAPPGKLGPAESMEIATGGMLPEGSDSVVMVEYGEILGGQVAVYRPAAPLENVLSAGEDYRPGDKVLPAGHQLRPQDLGILAALGIAELQVFSAPRVTIISTGDEVVPPEASPGPGQIRDVNGLTLSAQVRESGGEPAYRGIVRDDAEELKLDLVHALEEADVVLISGGSSVGTRDVTARVIDDLPGDGVMFHGVSMRPGKPLIYGAGAGKPVFGLSGNPVSAMFGFLLFVKPLLRQFQGLKPFQDYPPYVEALLDTNYSSPGGREDYVRVVLYPGSPGSHGADEVDLPRARPVYGGPGLLNPVVQGDGYFVIPRDSEGLNKGVRVKVFTW